MHGFLSLEAGAYPGITGELRESREVRGDKFDDRLSARVKRQRAIIWENWEDEAKPILSKETLMNVLKKKPSMEAFRAMVNPETHRVAAIIKVPAGALLKGMVWLNDYADECILPEGVGSCLSDLSYRVVGCDPGQYNESYVEGLLYVEVDALIEDDELLALLFKGDSPPNGLIAIFRPQKWKGDECIDLDDEVEFNATYAFLSLPLEQIRGFSLNDYDSDGLAEDLLERQTHKGPFEVDVDPDEWLESLGFPPRAELTQDHLNKLRVMFRVTGG